MNVYAIPTGNSRYSFRLGDSRPTKNAYVVGTISAVFNPDTGGLTDPTYRPERFDGRDRWPQPSYQQILRFEG
jgi:hypothetical protein